MGEIDISNDINKGKCDSIDIPDYSVLRDNNLKKINNYYDKLLESYTKNYKDYVMQQSSANVNDRTYANMTLKPKVQNANNQLLDLSKKMMDNINIDTDLIIEQKNELYDKTKQIDNLLKNIKLLKTKNNDMDILTKSRDDSLNSTTLGSETINFNTNIYIGINLLLLLCIIGFTIYIVYSNNTYIKYNNTPNNIHKSIFNNR